MTTEVQKVVVTAGPKAPRDGSIVETPTGKKDLQVKVMGRVHQILIRTLRTYLQGFVGFVVAGGSGAIDAVGDATGVDLRLPARDFVEVCILAASLSVAPAVIALLQNAVELLTDLEHRSPEWRA